MKYRIVAEDEKRWALKTKTLIEIMLNIQAYYAHEIHSSQLTSVADWRHNRKILIFQMLTAQLIVIWHIKKEM